MLNEKKNCGPGCPVETTLSLIGSKWKVLILRELSMKGTRRFGLLHRGVPGISQKILTQQLRQMEADGLVARRVYAEVPPRVEYSLTSVGRSLEPVLAALAAWGLLYQSTQGHPERAVAKSA